MENEIPRALEPTLSQIARPRTKCRFPNSPDFGASGHGLLDHENSRVPEARSCSSLQRCCIRLDAAARATATGLSLSARSSQHDPGIAVAYASKRQRGHARLRLISALPRLVLGDT
jgi:hypothetical protein